MKNLYRRILLLTNVPQKGIENWKNTAPWENLLVFQNYLNCSMEAARRYFKAFDVACWQRTIMVEQKPGWAPEPAALKLSLQDSIFLIGTHFPWLRNLSLFSIKALKTRAKILIKKLECHGQRILCGLIISVPMLLLFLSGAGELTAYLGKYSEHSDSRDALRDNSCMTLFQTKSWNHTADLTLLQ